MQLSSLGRHKPRRYVCMNVCNLYMSRILPIHCCCTAVHRKGMGASGYSDGSMALCFVTSEKRQTRRAETHATLLVTCCMMSKPEAQEPGLSFSFRGDHHSGPSRGTQDKGARTPRPSSWRLGSVPGGEGLDRGAPPNLPSLPSQSLSCYAHTKLRFYTMLRLEKISAQGVIGKRGPVSRGGAWPNQSVGTMMPLQVPIGHPPSLPLPSPAERGLVVSLQTFHRWDRIEFDLQQSEDPPMHDVCT
jgi:hypothetical protein